jgi:hypothetical protein
MAPAIATDMTNNEIKLSADDLLGAPNKSQVTAAAKYVQSFATTTEALVALVAALREMEATAQASVLEGICEEMAEVEIAEM